MHNTATSNTAAMLKRVAVNIKAIPSDYGRNKGIAWYYLGGFALTQTQQLQTRIVQWASRA